MPPSKIVKKHIDETNQITAPLTYQLVVIALGKAQHKCFCVNSYSK